MSRWMSGMNVRSWSMSARTMRCASGYWILMAIGVPSGHVPVWTWPRLAAAIASGSMCVPAGSPTTSGSTFAQGRGLGVLVEPAEGGQLRRLLGRQRRGEQREDLAELQGRAAGLGQRGRQRLDGRGQRVAVGGVLVGAEGASPSRRQRIAHPSSPARPRARLRGRTFPSSGSSGSTAPSAACSAGYPGPADRAAQRERPPRRAVTEVTPGPRGTRLAYVRPMGRLRAYVTAAHAAPDRSS